MKIGLLLGIRYDFEKKGFCLSLVEQPDPHPEFWRTRSPIVVSGSQDFPEKVTTIKSPGGTLSYC